MVYPCFFTVLSILRGLQFCHFGILSRPLLYNLSLPPYRRTYRLAICFALSSYLLVSQFTIVRHIRVPAGSSFIAHLLAPPVDFPIWPLPIYHYTILAALPELPLYHFSGPYILPPDPICRKIDHPVLKIASAHIAHLTIASCAMVSKFTLLPHSRTCWFSIYRVHAGTPSISPSGLYQFTNLPF